MKYFRKFVTWKGFAAVYFLVCLTALFYTSFRVQQISNALWGWGNTWAVFAVQFMFCAFFASQIRRVDTSRFARAISAAGYLYFCFLVYCMCMLLCADILILLAGVLAVEAAKIRVPLWILAFALAAGITAYGNIHARQFRRVTYTAPSGKLDTPCRIVLLSDLHMGMFVGARHIARMTEEVNALKPDLVVISGDIFDNGSAAECWEMERICGLFRKLTAKQGVFAVLGNHDPAPDDPLLQTFFSDSGIRLLLDEYCELPQLYLVGRDDILRSSGQRTPLRELMPPETEGKPVVVLDHSPDGFDEAAGCGADLILSGHTHKGQFFPATVFTKMFHPAGHFYGYTHLGNTHAVISAGAGYFQLPVRVGTDNEIVLVELQ